MNIQFFFNYYIEIINKKINIFTEKCDWIIPFFGAITDMIKQNLENIKDNDLMELKFFYFNFIAKFDPNDEVINGYAMLFLNKLMKFENVYNFTIPSLFLFLPFVDIYFDNINIYILLYENIYKSLTDENDKQKFLSFLTKIYTLYADYDKSTDEKLEIQIPIILDFINNLKNKEKIISFLKVVRDKSEYKNIKETIIQLITKL